MESGGKKNGRRRKRRQAGWACIRLSRATAHGATQPRQTMWRDPSGSRAMGLGATKKMLVFENLDLDGLLLKY